MHNLDTGSFKHRDLDTYTIIRFDMADIAAFDTPMCADLVAQVSLYDRPVWEECIN